MPILVGGTHYYTQALLFRDALANHPRIEEHHAKPDDSSQRWPILEASTAEMLAKLREVDPVMADRWHPNEQRKIRRSLEIYLQTGRKASDIYIEQQGGRAGSTTAHEPDSESVFDESKSSSLRTDTLIFWVHTDTSSLTDRLNSRVDNMLSAGLLDEVRDLTKYANTQNPPDRTLDTTTGIWIAIGYKEFLDYQKAIDNGAPEAETARLLHDAVEGTKAATRQYSKRQIRWIRIKLLNALHDAHAARNLFLLDGSDLERWNESVSDRAANLVQRFLDGLAMPDPKSFSPLAMEMLDLRKSDMSADVGRWEKKRCDVCDMTAVAESDWLQHLKSKKHKILSARWKKGALEQCRGGVCQQLDQTMTEKESLANG